jgi:hypothetical protein
MGWRPRSVPQRLGEQICKTHFDRHKDKADRFSLYDAFGFKRPPTKAGTFKLKDYCTCGKERQPGRKYCTDCIADRKRIQRKEYYHRKKNEPVQAEERNTLICRSEGCGNDRKPNHMYCDICAERRRQKSNRERQRRHYRKITICETA